ncbi:hypothetical protein [Streptomyces sp. NPDC013740]|uniref:hypothetical protein n=1 Tax=Streptomyces sp. NPDC013740 TaxID=3364867 RepID=UPI003701E984
MTTTAQQLQTIATLWPSLDIALGDRTQHAWPPPSLRGYLDALSHHDPTDAAALRALERSPDQLGARPVPISLPVLDTMRTVEAVLHETADQIASANQFGSSPHPHRWHYTGRRPGAAWTALWLSARASGVFWPGRALTEPQARHLGHVAREALHRVETALDLATGTRELAAEHTCPCGGRIVITGGAGDQPTARCRQCGAIWTERGVVAA